LATLEAKGKDKSGRVSWGCMGRSVGGLLLMKLICFWNNNIDNFLLPSLIFQNHSLSQIIELNYTVKSPTARFGSVTVYISSRWTLKRETGILENVDNYLSEGKRLV
jgi:hypothetical protein